MSTYHTESISATSLSADSNVHAQTSEPSNTKPFPSMGRGLAWCFLIACLFLFAVFIDGFIAGIEHASSGAGADFAAAEQYIESHLNSAAGMTRVAIWQFGLIVPLILLISRSKKQAISDTLALKTFSSRHFGIFLLAFALYWLGSILLAYWLPQPLPEVMVELMQGDLLTWMMIVVSGPILEELFFRGYLYRVLSQSKLGAFGTVLITSVLFTLVHAGQYNLIILSELLVFALILGFARQRSGSLYLPLLLHMLNNALSMVAI